MKSLIALGASLIALTTAAQANAETYTITYTGHVGDNAVDHTGIFGIVPDYPAQNLYQSAPFTAVFTFVLPRPGATVSGIDDTELLGSRYIYGDGASSPMLNASITINGRTFAFGATSGRIDQWNFETIDGRQDYAAFRDDDSSDGTFSNYSLLMGSSTSTSMVESKDPATPFTYTIQPGDYAYGSLSIMEIYGCTNSGCIRPVVGATLWTETISLRSAAPVPEPGEWAMMSAGLAVVGAAARRRRRALA